jgi:hypothetical protein
LFKYAVSLPDQYEKTRDADGGARKGNYTIIKAFCKKKISSRATASMAAAWRAQARERPSLFFGFIASGLGKKVVKAGQDPVQDENEGKPGIGLQPFVQKKADGETDQDGGGEHQPDRGIFDPFFPWFRDREGGQCVTLLRELSAAVQ